jgi:hypothetical protein
LDISPLNSYVFYKNPFREKWSYGGKRVKIQRRDVKSCETEKIWHYRLLITELYDAGQKKGGREKG